jgi:sodium/bile acid cotransporter 7
MRAGGWTNHTEYFPKTNEEDIHRLENQQDRVLVPLIIIWQTFDQAFESGAFRSLKGTDIVFIVLSRLLLRHLDGHLCSAIATLARQERHDCCGLLCSCQDTSDGVPLSVVMFAELSTLTKSKIQIPMIIFQGFQVAAGSLMTLCVSEMDPV